MAVTSVTTTMAGAINYTVVTDTSADWASVANSTYFYDKADKLVHYKDSAGTVQEIFSGSGITVGTTPSTGTDGRVFFQAGGVVQQDAAFFWDNTNKRLGVGATPSTSVRLDVRAQGALSTDIAFRVRNSADTVDLYRHQGDGGFTFKNNANTKFFYWDASNLFQFGTIGGQTLNVDVQSTAITRIETTSDILLEGVSTHKFIQYKNGNFQLEEASGIAQTSGAGGFSMKNAATIPSASSTDRFIMYSTDITAGNAAPHFRTENGNIIKLYQQSSAGIATVGDLVTVLQNLGLLS